MSWFVRYKNQKKIEKSVLKMRPTTRRDFLRAVKDLMEEGPHPTGWNTKVLKGKYSGCISLRIDYRHRMIYEAYRDIVTIVIIDVSTRENAYQ